MSRTKEFGKEKILAAAVRVAASKGYATMSRAAVAKAAGCSETLPSVYFGPMRNLRIAVVRDAIAKKNLRIIGQAVAAKDHLTRGLSTEIKHAATIALSRAL